MEFLSSECKALPGNCLQVFTVQATEGRVMLAQAFCPPLTCNEGPVPVVQAQVLLSKCSFKGEVLKHPPLEVQVGTRATLKQTLE